MARLEDKFRARAEGKTPALPLPLPALTPRADLLTELPLTQIQPDPDQPRKDLGDLTELKASIASVGVVQPILVSVLGYERYQIIAGERRFTAARELGLERIPAIVRSLEAHQRLELQIIENLHRQDLNPLEEAVSYRRLIDEFRMTQEEVGKRIGKSRNSVSELLRLLELPASIQSECRTSDAFGAASSLSKSLLLEIAKQPGEAAQRRLWEQAKRGQLTVKQARQQKPAVQAKNEGRKTQEAFGASRTGMVFRYPIQTDAAMVTLVFEASSATWDDIIAALEQALEGEKARRDASDDFLS